MNVVQRFVFGCICCLLLANASPLRAADKLPTEEDYYPITPFAIPEGIMLEAEALNYFPMESSRSQRDVVTSICSISRSQRRARM